MSSIQQIPTHDSYDDDDDDVLAMLDYYDAFSTLLHLSQNRNLAINWDILTPNVN